MKTRRFKNLTVFVAVAALVLGLSMTPRTQGQTGKVIELGDTDIITALIVAIDKQDRTVSLLGSLGDVTTFEVGPDVRNFEQIKVGNYVRIEYHKSVALYLGKHGTQPEADAGLIVARAPKGERPAGVAVGAVDVSTQVRYIDRTRGTVTLVDHDGRSVTVKVDQAMKEFDNLRVGDLVHARYTEAIAISVESAMPDDQADTMTFLFVQNARGVSYDSAGGTLTLEGVSPAVIFFADRPYRVAGHVLLPAFLQLWHEGADSFDVDPPNATLSILASGHVDSVVVEIANPRLSKDRLTYEVVKVLEGDLPTSGGINTLFIDGLLGVGALRGGARGAAGGAIIGAIAGDAGKGAAIGAGIGILGGAIKKSEQQKAAAQAQAHAQATTRVIYVPNANGSFTPVTLHLVSTGWQGPRGEVYPTLPTADQLKGYGMR